MHSKRFFWLIFALAAILRLWDLGRAYLWYDEMFTLLVSRLSLERMVQAVAGDTHPPLYYLLTWSLVHLGLDSEFWLRFPSILFGLASIYLAWKLAGELHLSEPARIGGLLFMAVSSMQLHYSQEARMYTMLQAEMLLAALLILRRRLGWTAVALTAALYTHNYAMIYMPALAGLAWMHAEDRRPTGRWVTPFTVAGMFWLPWAGALLDQMGTVAGGYWIQPATVGAQLYVVYMLFWGFAMLEVWRPLAIIATFIVVMLATVRTFQRPSRATITLLVLALAPLCLATLASLVWKPILLFRGLLPSSAALYLLAAWALTRGPKWQWLYAGALVLPITLAGLYGHYRYNPTNKGNITTTIAAMRAEWQEGDVIYHVGDSTWVGWQAYGADMQPQLKMPPCETLALGSLSPLTRRGLGIAEARFDDLAARRVWIVWSEAPTSPMCERREAQAIIGQADLFRLDKNDAYTYSGVWLYGKGQVSAP
jgi:uncharacterized membrane protein